MIIEMAILEVKKGQETQFEQDFATAGQYISAISGYLSHRLTKCIEHENKYMLLVEWEKLEDHTVGFRQSEEYVAWKTLLHHYYEPFPIVEHFYTIIEHAA